MVTPDTCPILTPNVRGRTIDNEAVLVLPDQGLVKVRDIATALCAEYKVEQEQAEADTLAFVAELEAKGILSLSPGRGGPQ